LTYISNPDIKKRAPRRGSNPKILKNSSSIAQLEDKPLTIPKSEPMDVDDDIKKLSPTKRANSKDEASKKYKRIRVLESSEDEDESKMKENRKVDVKDEFIVTKVAIEPDEKPVPKIIAQTEKNRSNSRPKQNSQTSNQLSITNFFKPPKKK